MFQPFPLFVGLRYLRAKRRHQFISFVSSISLGGMVLGVMSLIIVLSVMNGFARELHSRILHAIPHAYLESPQGIDDWQLLASKVKQVPRVIGVAPVVGGNGMLTVPGRVRGVHLSGVLPAAEREVSEVGAHMALGALDDLRAGEFGIVLGASLARGLGVELGDKVTVILPKVTITPAGAFPRVKRFTVVGTFEVGAQVDSSEALIHIEDAARLFQVPSGVQGLRLKVADMIQVEHTLDSVLAALPAGYEATPWTQTQGGLFQAVKMEKTMVTLLLLIIVAVAAFNIVSILSMMVADKRANIAVMRTLGATPREIMAIFMVQGTAIGVVGTGLGALLGIPLAMWAGDIVGFFERISGLEMFDPSVYFITRLPSELQWGDVGMVCFSALLLSGLATLYPSWRAAQIGPAEALRYE